MKITNKPFIDNAIKYGLISTGISFLLVVIYYVFDVNIFNWIFSIFSFVISIAISVILIVLGINEYRVKYSDGQIKYWPCVLQSFLIVLIGGLLASIINFLFYNYVAPEYMAKQLESFMTKLQEYNLPQEKIDEIYESTQSRMQPLNQLLSALMFIPAMAAILSLIVSAFVKKKDNSFESNFN